jgi:act minimal PKS acyl carrier protein
MQSEIFALRDLKRILTESAGAGQGIDLDGEILDTTFDDLGYDSIALLETAARISREYRVMIDDDELFGVKTPRELIALVNSG